MADNTIQRWESQFAQKFRVMNLVKNAMKYIFEGLAVALAAFYFPSWSNKGGLKVEEIAAIALTAAATFALLDLWAGGENGMYGNARMGAGFAIGSNLAGGLVR
mgnify:CR=1 FL=1